MKEIKVGTLNDTYLYAILDATPLWCGVKEGQLPTVKTRWLVTGNC